MQKKLLAVSLLAFSSAALVGCGDKQPDCGSDTLSKTVTEKVGEELLSNMRNSDLKFADVADLVKQNHIELRNMREISADEKNQTKTCAFSVSVQPVDGGSARYEAKDMSATIAIDSEGKEVVSTHPSIGYAVVKKMERVEVNNPSDEQKAYLEARKKKEQEKKEKEEQFKKQVLAVPADQYKFISSEDLTWLYLARNSKLDDKAMLNMVSAKYYNESDEFAKKDIEKSEIPAMKAKLQEYKALKYIKFVSSQSQLKTTFDTVSGAPVLNVFVPGAMPEKYDFDKQLYPLTIGGCDKDGLTNYFVGNNQNVKVEWLADTAVTNCQLKPKDEAQAREWNDIFKAEQYAFRHENYAVISLALNDELTEDGLLGATLVRVEVNYNGDKPLKLTTQ